MPRIPDVTDLGGRRTPQATRGVQNVRGIGRGVQRAADIEAAGAREAGGELISLGRGLGETGQAIRAAEKRRREAAEELALVGARSRRAAALLEAEHAFDDDPNYDTYETRYDAAANKAIDKLTETLPGHLRGLFQAESIDDVARGAIAVRGKANKARADNTVAFLDDLAERNIQPGAADADRTNALLDYGIAVEAARDTGAITRVDAAKRKRDFAIRYAQSTVSEWYRGQPDRYEAAQAIYDNKIPDPKIQGILESLPPDERAEVFRGVVEESSKLYTLRNQEREERERLEKDAVDRAVKAFFFDQGMTDGTRAELFRSLSRSSELDLGTMMAMDAFVREGGERQDFEIDVLRAEAAIRRGEIPTDVDLIRRIGSEDWNISFNTMRTRLMPQLEAQGDEVFGEALRWGQAELGIITGAGLLGDLFKDPVNKAAQLEAELRRFRRDNPTGDLWGHAEKVVTRLKQTGNTGAAQALPTLAANYRAALQAGDAEQINNARQALAAIMIEAGMVTAIEAARSDFDPLAVIDAPPGTGR